ncbi:uncharacterized protein LOC119385478 [Rhipicephalus sanguineus]|uniref:uncharacterized protein LOC119385478 n=1 Tax=Rhipicephalus sanguineus TaxID=34632 RepID=UPI001893DB4A|nr:uncharacterized protein LOC119385478 [Rhipicephalus sanguineus]
MRLIKTQILDSNTRDTRVILGLDLEKAFDNIHHSFILDSISNLGLGASFHAFVRSFLEGRSALLKVGDKMALSNRGTPKGSVISPLLFNIAMVGLSEGLGKIQGIGHTVYVDDITIWCAGGSDGHTESALQEAIDYTESFLQDTGLRCSPSKSELLLNRPSRLGRKPKDWKPLAESDINLHTKSGDIIPRVPSIRILGMIVESSGTNSQTILRLAKNTSTIGLIRRVANRRSGLAEDNLVRLIHAFLLCLFTYVAAMHVWRRAERDKLNAIIRRGIKSALGIPNYTQTERLLQLGMHNTLEEIVEAQERAQVIRLSGTKAGRRLLMAMSIPSATVDDNYQGLPRR